MRAWLAWKGLVVSWQVILIEALVFAALFTILVFALVPAALVGLLVIIVP